MENFLIISATIISVFGLIGCFVPAIPGPPVNYIALLLMQWAIEPFRLRTLLIWALLTVGVIVIDYLLPVWTAKKFGATKQGIQGSIIGMLIGMFLTPVGMLAGLVIGSIIGDLVARQTLSQATRSAAGSLFGTLITIGIKLSISGMMTLMVIYNTIQHFQS